MIEGADLEAQTNKPKLLLSQELRWEYRSGNYYKFRLVAVPTEFGFDGVDYILEKQTGVDAMGQETYIKCDTMDLGLGIAAIGQYLLDVSK